MDKTLCGTRPALWVLVAVALALGAHSPAGSAKLYKWVDEDGNVTYSQKPPPVQPGKERVEAETIELKNVSQPAPAPNAQVDAIKDKAETIQKDREFKDSAAAEQAARNDRLKKNCEIARQNMRILKNSPRIKSKDADGNDVFLDEESIKGKIQQTQQQIEDNCGA